MISSGCQQIGCALRFVPGNVKRNRGRRTNEFMDRRAVFQLFENITRLSRSGKTCKTRSAGTYAPRRDGHLKSLCFFDNAFNIDAAARQLVSEVVKIFSEPFFLRLVLFGNKILSNFE